jgi:hypothetical protein
MRMKAAAFVDDLNRLIQAVPNDRDTAVEVMCALMFGAAGVHQAINGAPHSREQLRELVVRALKEWEDAK